MVRFLDVYENVDDKNKLSRILGILSDDYDTENICNKDSFDYGQGTYFITFNDKLVGSLDLLHEKNDSSFLVLNINILEKFRGKGIGTRALQFLRDLGIEEFIIGEARKDNRGANKSIVKVGVKVAETEECNYYLLQKERLEEFIDNNFLEKIAKHFIKSKNKSLSKIKNSNK